MALSKLKPISAVWWNLGGWFDLVSAFRLSCSLSRLAVAFSAVVLTWIIAGLWDAIWVLCGGHPVVSRFASGSLDQWPSIIWGSRGYSIILSLLLFWIWALAIGAVCRGQVLNYGPGLHCGFGQSFGFSKKHFWSWVRAAVLLPAACLPFAVVCVLNGLIIRIPWVGDILGGLMLGLSLACGLVIAYFILLWVLTLGFYGPAIATDGFGAAECVVRCATYVQSRLFRSVWLIVVGLGLVLGAWFVGWFVFGMGESCARGLMRVAGALWAGEGPNRIDVLWPIDASGSWQFNRDAGMGLRYRISHALLGGWRMLFMALLWAWVINLLLCVLTIAYVSIREDVDGVKRDDAFGLETGGDFGPTT